MANKRISDLPPGSTIAGTDLFEIEQGGVSYCVTGTQLIALAKAAITGTANRISVGSGVIDISGAYSGQASIDTVGHIVNGTWSGRFEPREIDFVSVATASIDAYTTDIADLFLNQDVSIDLVNIVTSPPTEGQSLWVRWLDDGSPRALEFDPTFFRFANIQEPTTTIVNQTGLTLFVWNDTDSVFDCVLNSDATSGAPSSAPSIAAGAGAGTGPTITLAAGSINEAGVITIVAGVAPTIGGIVATLTFSDSFAFSNGCSVILGNADNATALVAGATIMFGSGTTTTIVITNYSGGALTGAVTYKLNYQVKGY